MDLFVILFNFINHIHFFMLDENPYAEVLSLSDSSVHISFAPSPREQRDVAENGISG
jgi:hypothetical protein